MQPVEMPPVEYAERLAVPLRWWVQGTMLVASLWLATIVALPRASSVAVPPLDARIAGRLGLRPDVRRVPIFGLGCVAGAAGVAAPRSTAWPGG